MKKLTSKKTIFASLALLLLLAGGAAQAAHNRIDIDVWADHGFDSPYYADDAFELYLRPAENCFVTVMVIDPDGYANVIYPIDERRQRRLYRNRVYRLSELLDEPLYFYGLDGRAHISVIATRRPVFLNPWLLDEVHAFSYRPYSLNAFGIRVYLGPFELEHRFAFYWTRHVQTFGYSVFTTPIVIRAHYGYRPVYYRDHHRKVWHKKWKYRSQRPVFHKRHDGRDRRYDRRPDHVRRRPIGNDDRNRRYDRRPDQIQQRDTVRDKDTERRSHGRPEIRRERDDDERARPQVQQPPRTRVKKENSDLEKRQETRTKAKAGSTENEEKTRKPSRRTKKQ